MSNQLVKGCPWCGSLPTHDVVKHHNCGEPYFAVYVCCKNCGVRMCAIASDEDCDEASDIGQVRYASKQQLLNYWDCVAHVVIKNRLLARWNERKELP